MTERTGSARMAAFAGSGIRRVFEAAGALEGAGVAIAHLEIGRPDFDTPTHIKAAAIDALQSGRVHYTSNAGIPELRSAIADKLARDNGLRVDPDGGIIVTVGAKESVFMCLYGLLDPGDEIIVPTPMWPDYLDTSKVVGAQPVEVPLQPGRGYQLDAGDLEGAITPRTKAIVVHSPHNPTGAVCDESTLREVAELAVRSDLLVIADEIYEHLIYDEARHVSIASLPGMFERTVTINGFSKAYSMTGWRLGYVAGPPALISPLLKVHQCTTTCATSFAQWGAVAAYRGDQTCVTEMVREFDRRRRLVIEALRGMPGVELVAPRGAFYAFPDVRRLGRSDLDVAEYLLREAHVATVPGSTFGETGAGHLRISYAAGYDILAGGLERMGRAVAALASNAAIR
ncbi:MAG TPA: pyridoxal phosphate-dependent aminotransferase [bacterium]